MFNFTNRAQGSYDHFPVTKILASEALEKKLILYNDAEHCWDLKKICKMKHK